MQMGLFVSLPGPLLLLSSFRWHKENGLCVTGSGAGRYVGEEVWSPLPSAVGSTRRGLGSALPTDQPEKKGAKAGDGGWSQTSFLHSLPKFLNLCHHFLTVPKLWQHWCASVLCSAVIYFFMASHSTPWPAVWVHSDSWGWDGFQTSKLQRTLRLCSSNSEWWEKKMYPFSTAGRDIRWWASDAMHGNC